MTQLRAAAVSLAGLGLVGLPVLASTPASAATTCAGRTATIVGTPGPDALIGTAGDDVVVLGDGDDTFSGGDGDDVVCGGDGADALYGDAGNDELWGGSGNDVLHDTYGTNEIQAGPGHDSVSMSSSGRVVAGTGNDRVGAGDDAKVFLGEGQDTAVLTSGSPQVWGGPGHDQFRVEYDAQPSIDGEGDRDALVLERRFAGDVIDLAQHTGTVQVRSVAVVIGSDQDDTILGSSAPDELLVGAEGDDVVHGRGGRDPLDPGPGDDRVVGGPGADELWLDNGVAGVAVDVPAGRAESGDDLDTFSSVEIVIGTSFDDAFTGTDGADYFDAGSGVDRVSMGAGEDELVISRGSASMGSGNDVVAFTTFTSGDAVDATVDLGPGADSARIQLGRPTVRGGGGADAFLVTGRAVPSVHGGPGRDTLRLQDRRRGDVIDLARHTGTVLAWSVERIFGSARADVLHGAAAAEVLDGGGGDDRVFGRGGADLLRGGRGSDLADGGPGADRCDAERRRSC